jgi:hypothetical protein
MRFKSEMLSSRSRARRSSARSRKEKSQKQIDLLDYIEEYDRLLPNRVCAQERFAKTLKSLSLTTSFTASVEKSDDK